MVIFSYATFLPIGIFLWLRSAMVIPSVTGGGNGSTGVNVTSGGW
jgi:hypothetical protein